LRLIDAFGSTLRPSLALNPVDLRESMMKRFIATVFTACTAVAMAGLLSACATTSPDVISYRDAQRNSHVRDGVILNIRPVRVDGSQSGLGAMAGGVAGGVAGSTVGGYRDGFVGSIVGAVVGGVLGNAIERSATTEQADEIVVQLNNGERRAIVQAHGSEALREGDAVLLIQSGNRVRLTRATGTTAPAPAAPASRNPAQPGPGYRAPGDPIT
jgi:outer membrane lipoprotein SlyB